MPTPGSEVWWRQRAAPGRVARARPPRHARGSPRSAAPRREHRLIDRLSRPTPRRHPYASLPARPAPLHLAPLRPSSPPPPREGRPRRRPHRPGRGASGARPRAPRRRGGDGSGGSGERRALPRLRTGGLPPLAAPPACRVAPPPLTQTQQRTGAPRECVLMAATPSAHKKAPRRLPAAGARLRKARSQHKLIDLRGIGVRVGIKNEFDLSIDRTVHCTRAR